MKKSRTYLIKILSLVFALCFLLSSCATSVDTLRVKYAEFKSVTPTYSGDGYHKLDGTTYKTICKSGLIELLFDTKTKTIAIRDTNTDMIWATLPSTSVKKEIASSAVEIKLSNGGDTVYTLNSQDNAVNFGNVEATTSEKAVTVKYSLALDAETGKKNVADLENKEIRADVTVVYALKDGALYVNMSMNNVSLPEGVYIENVSLLNNFGAYETSGENDYIFVPDGSGALIMTGVEDDNFSPVSLSVYGNNGAVKTVSDKSNCVVGAFGMKRDESAFLCIVENGDTIAKINAFRNDEENLNSVYASFNTTDIHLEQAKNKVAKTYGYEYANEITLCYRFLSGKSATYSGMATALRENLIRNSVLSSKTVDVSGKSIPLVVALQGGYVDSDNDYITLSTYDQALSLMTLLKAKGINNSYLRYNGITKNANNGSLNDYDNFAKSLGSAKDFQKLYSYLSSQTISLFIDTDILTFKYKSSQTAKNVVGDKQKLSLDSSAFPKPTTNQGFLRLSLFENRIENILKASENMSFDGYALNDLGSYLYSDYSSEFFSRESAKLIISTQASVLSSAKLLMVDTGNIYAVKSADVISNIPMSPTANQESSAYVGIPFIQLTIHGISEYSAKGINTNDNMANAFLKAIEYGCIPSVEWYCTKYNDELDKKYYYDSNINDIVAYYEKANELLGDIRDARMTSHYKVQDGVFCTEYNNSTKIYVNYTSQPVSVNGVTIDSMDCMKIS